MCQQLDAEGPYSVPDPLTFYSVLGPRVRSQNDVGYRGRKRGRDREEHRGGREREGDWDETGTKYVVLPIAKTTYKNLNSGLTSLERCSDIDWGCSYYLYCGIKWDTGAKYERRPSFIIKQRWSR